MSTMNVGMSSFGTRNAEQVALKWLLIWHLQAFRHEYSAELTTNKEGIKHNNNDSANANKCFTHALILA